MTMLFPTPLSASPIEILLVEDSEPDIHLTREAFSEAGIANTLHIARDGVEALELLRCCPDRPKIPRPDVILLDINMPRMNGLEVLEELKRDPDLMTIPVIMLTTSQAEEDVLRSYQAYAASYVVKPVEFDRFYEAIRALGRYMLTIVRPRAPESREGPRPTGRCYPGSARCRRPGRPAGSLLRGGGGPVPSRRCGSAASREPRELRRTGLLQTVEATECAFRAA
ncbi:response regulator [Deinococcus malanensis]|uniref:response regulator n=1 Tax=Deinococcus malanensis TaxID=1706855 RepID=UPI00362F2521